ncbi:MAG: hypothetical protein C0609_07965 [Deltaproteobacteria bacterium]|nr:MAG: hypothetical protein C0609_07965 [Deltaproteobacteria bacterium]
MRKLLYAGVAVSLITAPTAALCAVEGLDLSLSTEFRYRMMDTDGGDENDLDWLNRLSADYKWRGDINVDFSTLLWYGKDLDGGSGDEPTVDQLDTYGSSDTLRLYRASATMELSEIVGATVGRQDVWSAERATLDGVSLTFKSPCGYMEGEIFGGSRVSFYSDPDEDDVYGFNFELRPSSSTRFTFEDIYYLENTFEAAIVQKLGSLAMGRIAYRHFDDSPVELSAEAVVNGWEDGELVLSYKRKLSDADDSYGFDYTAFGDEDVEALNFGTFAPYSDYAVELRQIFGDFFGYGKLRRHNLIDEDDEDEYNTDFTQATAGIGYSKGSLRIDAELSRWVESRSRSDLDEENSWGWALLGEKKFDGGYKTGASLAQETYDTLGRERETSAVCVWGTVPVLELATLDLRYQYETDDLYEDDGIDSVSEFTTRLNFNF